MAIDKRDGVQIKDVLSQLPHPSIVPVDIQTMQEELLEEFRQEQLCPNTRTKMVLISKALRLFAAQYTLEAMQKTRALTVTVAYRAQKGQRLLNG